MEEIYYIIIIILFVLAITDLFVGVSNDAVNFLVPALGAKASKFWVILSVASLGVLIGAIFSNGMMEVARKGIFNPDKFVFSEIILIFLAVMFTDIILLDAFNTLGFPTSTTVSLVFELLGAAVAVSIYKLSKNNIPLSHLSEYINSSKTLVIISGILLSIVVAFTVGAIVQWIARIIFTFEYEKTYKYFGSLWAGFAFTVIVFFMFIKGFKNSTFHDAPFVQWVLHNQLSVLIIGFLVFSVFFEILKSIFKINILRIVVLAGTFALAMAFAGNDLVNFIGVPLAGYKSYVYWHSSGLPADSFSMGQLSGKVDVNPIFLFIAGIIMIITLWTSKKARSVTETSINLARQDAGYERFGSTYISRALVRAFINVSNFVKKITPSSVSQWIEKRFFNPYKKGKYDPNAASFDLIRASVNLVVASILIAIATSYKLPLSTTYVTFMVAMGSSLADRAWGRESAVYRVTGVISVISGWFLTALVAFIVAFTVAIILAYGSTIAIGMFIVIDILIFIRSRKIHRERMKKEEEEKQKIIRKQQMTKENIFERIRHDLYSEIEKVARIIETTYEGFTKADRKILKRASSIAHNLKQNSKNLKSDIYNIIQILKPDYLLSGQFYVQVIDALREVANAATFLADRMYEHIDNNHEIFSKEQMDDFAKMKDITLSYVDKVLKVMKSSSLEKTYDELKKLKNSMSILKTSLLRELESYKTMELQRIQNYEVDTVNSTLFLNTLEEMKNIIMFSSRFIKAFIRFYSSKNKI